MVERYAHLAPDHLAKAANRLDPLFGGYDLATSENGKGRSSDQPLDFLVGRVGIEPTTNGLRAQPIKHRIILIINLFSRVG